MDLTVHGVPQKYISSLILKDSEPKDDNFGSPIWDHLLFCELVLYHYNGKKMMVLYVVVIQQGV